MIYDVVTLCATVYYVVHLRSRLVTGRLRHRSTLFDVAVYSCRSCVHTAQAENVVVYRPAHRAIIPLVYSRSKGLPDCRRLHLERFAGGCDLWLCLDNAWR